MPPTSIRTCCPHCGMNTAHALMPNATSKASSGSTHASANGRLGLVAQQRFVCTDCERPWEAAIVPRDQLARLREAVTALDEAKRQIAMLRLIMSKDQIDRAEKSHGDVIKLRRAA